MNIDYSVLRFWFDVLQFLLTGGVGFYVYLSNRHRVTNSRIRELERDMDQRLDDHHQRLARVEEHVKHLPTHADIGAVHERLNAIHGELRSLAGVVSALNRSLHLVNEHLLNGRK